MGIEIGDAAMSSDVTAHTAVQVTGGSWRLSWLPDRTVTRDQAVTGMVLAEAVVGLRDPRDQNWRFVGQWAKELGLDDVDALVRVMEPPASGLEGETGDRGDGGHGADGDEL